MSPRKALTFLAASAVATAALALALVFALSAGEPSSSEQPSAQPESETAPATAGPSNTYEAGVYCASVRLTKEEAQRNLESMLKEWDELPAWYREWDRLSGLDDPDALNWKDIEEARRALEEMPPEGQEVQVEGVSIGAGPAEPLPPAATPGPCPTPAPGP